MTFIAWLCLTAGCFFILGMCAGLYIGMNSVQDVDPNWDTDYATERTLCDLNYRKLGSWADSGFQSIHVPYGNMLIQTYKYFEGQKPLTKQAFGHGFNKTPNQVGAWSKWSDQVASQIDADGVYRGPSPAPTATPLPRPAPPSPPYGG